MNPRSNRLHHLTHLTAKACRKWAWIMRSPLQSQHHHRPPPLDTSRRTLREPMHTRQRLVWKKMPLALTSQTDRPSACPMTCGTMVTCK